MKLDSKLFDRIRIRPDPERLAAEASPPCEWPNCSAPGAHPAPKGRGHEGEYHRFCLEHVREYNKSYNYFAGMRNEEIIAFQKSAVTGHRPTWRMGNGTWRPGAVPRGAAAGLGMDGASDPFGLFGRFAAPAAAGRRHRPVRNAERRALMTLGLDETADGAEVKARYKALV